MKKILFLVALFFSTAGMASAASYPTVCNAPDHPSYNEGVLIACFNDADYQKDRARAVENSSSEANKLPVITQKTVITDGQGHFDFCPSFYGRNCVITNPSFHVISMTWDVLHTYFPFVNKF